MADRYLVDLALPRSPAGELRATPTGDAKLSRGRDNVAQALERRTLTREGGLLHRPDYGAGLKGSVGRSSTPTERAKQADKIQRQMSRDSRVSASETTVKVDAFVDSRVVVNLAVQLVGDDTAQTLTINVSE